MDNDTPEGAGSCAVCRGAKYIVVGMIGIDDVGRERPPLEYFVMAFDDVKEAIHKANSLNGQIFELSDGEISLIDSYH